MRNYAYVIVGSILLSTVSHAVPLEGISQTIDDQKDAKLDDQPYGLPESNVKENKPGQREKRFYNYFDYNNDFNINPDFPIPLRQNIQRREPYNSFGNYGSQDPLDLILTKLQEIARDRTYLPPRTITVPVPTYIPVLYVPKVTCDCTSNDATKKPSPVNNKTMPDFPDRFSPMDDTQNSDSSEDYTEDEGSRPLSFNPVTLEEPLSKPPPPLEHGSVQAGLEPAMPEVTTRNPVTQEKDVTDSSKDSSPPTPCEKASVSCCLQPTVNYGCFRSYGCNDLAYFKNGCVLDFMLPAIQKLERFLKQKVSTGS
ncbi:uncharacterized protein LOC123711455 [Pieris brassicae]|uniref:uncharacterized protein LOC123711455 n=1 Tax=Pieris brassicae TaxID=7116 RepID=UPI001E6615E7|nr:uncharacterized protein LOC123711455 [Pieris brassicae]XP_045520015.1 uncharacterized protein LOC123711455 [Pieris brassicae]XP_045520016.1 uncharacterized protein LOC123711455 [Pieris brassicae]